MCEELEYFNKIGGFIAQELGEGAAVYEARSTELRSMSEAK